MFSGFAKLVPVKRPGNTTTCQQKDTAEIKRRYLSHWESMIPSNKTMRDLVTKAKDFAAVVAVRRGEEGGDIHGGDKSEGSTHEWGWCFMGGG